MAGSSSAARHVELLAEGGLYAELYRTQFEQPGSPVLAESELSA